MYTSVEGSADGGLFGYGT